MSIQLMAEVLNASPYEGTALLVHVILANHANDDGVCWPSIGRIAQQCRCTDRRVQQIIAEMAKDGLIVRSERPGHSNLFKVRSISEGCNPLQGGDEAGFTPGVKRVSPRKVSEPSVEPGPATRARDEIFEAVCEVCRLDLDGLTKDERGRVNAAAKQFKEIEASVDEIRKRAREYRRIFPNVVLTPQALTGNWSQLAPVTPVERREYRADNFVPEPPITEADREAGLAALKEIAKRFRVTEDA